MSPNREFILLSLILPNFLIWVWEVPWDVTGGGNLSGEATGGPECRDWGPPAPKGCSVWPPPASEEDSHATENALGESPLKKSLFGRPTAISSPLKLFSPALETHLSVAAPYYALCMQTAQHRATEFGHEPGEQSLRKGEGMALGCTKRLHSPGFSIGIKTFFLKVRTDVKAKLDTQTSGETFLLSEAQICTVTALSGTSTKRLWKQQKQRPKRLSWVNPSPTAAPCDKNWRTYFEALLAPCASRGGCWHCWGRLHAAAAHGSV